MDLFVILLVCATALVFVGTHLEQNRHAGPLRSTLMAHTIAVGLYLLVYLLMVQLVRAGILGSRCTWICIAADLASALAASFALAIVHYLAIGVWRRRYYLLALLALLPEFGHFLSAALWIFIPLRAGSTRRGEPGSEAWLKAETIVTGTFAGGLWMLLAGLVRTLDQAPLVINPLGAVFTCLFLYAGLNTHRDPENEFSFSVTAALVKGGLAFILPACFLTPYILEYRDFHILARFLGPALILGACGFLFILTMHFDSRGIRTFLVLFLLSLLPTAFQQLYAERLGEWMTSGLRLFSRVTLVLASLFILKQYMRWGFPIVQNMVMIITAIASASIVFVILAVAQPGLDEQTLSELELVRGAILLLDLVVLASLPPVIVNYGHGTMKVTWALLTSGLLLETYQDFLPATVERFEVNITGLLSYALIALAFAVLWRFSVAMMQRIEEMAGEDLS